VAGVERVKFIVAERVRASASSARSSDCLWRFLFNYGLAGGDNASLLHSDGNLRECLAARVVVGRAHEREKERRRERERERERERGREIKRALVRWPIKSGGIRAANRAREIVRCDFRLRVSD